MDDPSWLQKLGKLDRVVARQWLRQVGETRLRRIAAALVGAGKPGAPRKSLPPAWIRRTIETFLTSEGASIGDAAGVTARQVVEEGGAQGTAEAIRRKLSDHLRFLDDPTGRDVREHVDPVAEALRTSGQSVRRDLYPSGFASTVERWGRAGKALKRGFAPPSGSWTPSNPSLQRHLAYLEEQRRLVLARRPRSLFYEAFEHIIPESTPVTVADELFLQVEEFLRAEFESRSETGKSAETS